MTVKEWLEEFLTDRGMSEDQAEEVLKEAIPQIERLAGAHKITWDTPHDGYSTEIYINWIIILCDVVLNWIDGNCPGAWFRSEFE